MDEYTLLDLCEAADVTPRTVRYYISSGLMPPAASQGPRATYPADALLRLRLIKALQRQHLPLAEIRSRLDALSPAERAQLLEPGTSTALDYISQALSGARAGDARGSGPSGTAPPPPAPQQAVLMLSEPPAQPYTPARSTWERTSVHPDVEIHVRRPLDADTRRKLDRLLDHARTLFTEKT
ncbi:MAG: MerR family transcriptional regulator [Deltaproteobacteria bacterium]|nr:MerR family transcriptional regulator [Deltaproteobacteria bacterium]